MYAANIAASLLSGRWPTKATVPAAVILGIQAAWLACIPSAPLAPPTRAQCCTGRLP